MAYYVRVTVCVCVGGGGGGPVDGWQVLFLGRLSQRTFEDPSRLQSVKSIEEEP